MERANGIVGTERDEDSDTLWGRREKDEYDGDVIWTVRREAENRVIHAEDEKGPAPELGTNWG